MHEYPITQHIVEIALKAAGNRNVKAVTLIMGDDCGYLFESIELYFDILCAGTPCEGARLGCERVKPQLKCRNCGEMFFREPFSFACPACGGDGAPTDIGREFIVKSIEVGD